ncbi:MAG: hypothetical protein M1840_006122 [Geoglossum simile]|nr:MAG: hypothetical protein M1840_006122 [Geoglossum simile]
MHGLRILTLNVTLLLFTVKLKTVAAWYEPAGQYAHGWPVDAKFWPEDGPFRPRDLESFNSEPERVPVGVRKMSGDEREKFYTDYWMFDGSGTVGGERPMLQPLESKRVLRPRDDDEALQLYNNASTPRPFKAPILLHTNDHDQTPLNRRSPRAALLALQNRDFKCPGGTTDCSSIGRPNSCCANGEVCQIIPNTGLGDVGCCPVGKGCSGDLKNCDLGFTKCSDDLGGGCCIPEYVCVQVGCEFERFLCSLPQPPHPLPPALARVPLPPVPQPSNPAPPPSAVDAAAPTVSAVSPTVLLVPVLHCRHPLAVWPPPYDRQQTQSTTRSSQQRGVR